MRSILLVLALAVLSGALPAQDLPRPSKEAQATYDELAAEVQQYRRDWQMRQLEALKNRKPGDRTAISMVPPIGPYVKLFQAEARRFAGAEDAVPFLVWLAMNGQKKEAQGSAAKTLMQQHLKSPGLGDFALALPRICRFTRAGEANVWLTSLVTTNPWPEVRARALYARALPILKTAPSGSDPYRSARKDLKLAASLTKDTRMQDRALAAITSREKLQEGMVAPDIEGKDLDGVAFKLSDYRGKVVLLDFWGHW